jgi:hypothetical protein
VSILVEDGTGVVGANSLVHPSFAASYHADRGDLTDIGTFSVAGATFTPPYEVVVPLTGDDVPVNSIILIEGATDLGNVGFGYVTGKTATDTLTVRWFDEMAAEVSDIVLTVWAQNGWWSTRLRLESTLINATELVSSRTWLGTPVNEVQGTPFPRQNLYVSSTGQFYSRGYLIPDDEVPVAVLNAVCHVALEDVTEKVAEVVRPKQQLLSKKIGPIEKSFSNPRGLRMYPVVERMLWGLYVQRSGFRPLRST